ncbi:Protein GrpE [Gracilariopsis chorda]|uniref:GrpE protein homolog n=1 Tax=Gracilariopsis chorda TaxID=448386 RepID=A0A2V3IHP7_9FLOR|nr:Protein GrpE [Gracilariopsis chorda]|eukprot:PXF41616.1 Protein GrpE [Gracilariopsis chorda]
MERTPSKLAFAASAGTLSSSTSAFCIAVTAFRPSGTVRSGRRCNRARIVALGPSAPPPPSNEPEEAPELEVESQTPDTASDSEPDSLQEVTADDILNSPSFLKKKLEIVQKELNEAKAAIEEGEDAVKEEKGKYVRLAADFENYRRRSMEDLRKQGAKSTAKVCKEILQVLDNFERAIAAVQPETEREKSISSSYQAINRQLLDALTKLKVEPMDAVGETFDPSLHEAIQKVESEEFNEDVVCQQFQRGYCLGDVLIRPAVVAVSSGPGPEGESASDASDDQSEGFAEEAGEVEQPV